MLHQRPSSRNISLNHVLDWEKVFDQCKTHQDNYSDKDLKCNLQSVFKNFPHLALRPNLFLPHMTHTRILTRDYQYKYSDKVSSC